MPDTTNQSDSDFKLKPCITEILRTDYCQAGLIMLVDKVVLVTMTKTEFNRAYRLYLSDGEKSIQAVLTPLMHRFVYTGEIREGSYVKLDKYKLAFGKKLVGAGHVAYLAISDIQTIGLRTKYAQDRTFENHGLLTELPEEHQPPPRPCKIDQTSATIDGSYAVFKDPAADDSLVGFVSKFDAEGEVQDTSEFAEASTAQVKTPNKRKRSASTPLGDISLNEISVPEERWRGNKIIADTDTVTLPKRSKPDSLPKDMYFYNKTITAHQKRCHEPAVVHSHSCHCTVCAPGDTMKCTSDANDSTTPTTTDTHSLTTKEPQPKPQPQPQPTTSLSQAALLALEIGQPLKPLTTPLSLRPLSSISSSRHTRNQRGDYLAIISWVDSKTIKRPTMQLKRDLRLVDPSTDRAVLLSVFADPINFTPAVGTVALFRNLRTHEWDGGSLNAYEKDCKGFEWFVPNPVGVRGCDVQGLREWWVRRQEGEREVRREGRRVREVVGERKVAPVCHDRCVRGGDREMVEELEGMGLVGKGKEVHETGFAGDSEGEENWVYDDYIGYGDYMCSLGSPGRQDITDYYGLL